MSRMKLWPHGAIVAGAFAVIAGLGVWFYAKHEPTVAAETLPNAARIQRIEGEVAFCDDRNTDANSQWTTAKVNQPFSEGDRIYTRDNARTSLAFNGRNFARLDPNTSLDIVSYEDRRTQLALRDGSAMFEVGYLQPNELFEVATPNGAIDFAQPGLYNVGINQNGGVLVSVLSGLARVVGQTGSGEINKGEMLTLLGQTAAEVALSRLNRQDAGTQVDNYYRYQYPDSYDGRYSNYDTYLNDPQYYDPYQRNVSYKYASSNIPGLNDLDSYGDWQNVGNYGYAWRPRVDAGWVPYQQGQWTSSNTYGPTWVSSEPWGYAPYHYGRWANVSNQWYWVPDRANTTPSYAPALVAFVSDKNQAGWVPLGPGDSYAPRYYDNDWQPHYLTRNNVVPAQLANFSVPGAVTVVPVDAWGRPIERRTLQRIDQQRLASMKSTLDPLTLTPLRNAVVHSAWGRGKMDLPPGIAKKLYDTRVFVGNDVRESQYRRDVPKSMRVERVSDQARNQKFQVKDERQQEQQADAGRKLDMGRVNGEANKDNKAAQQQTRQLEQQQRKDTRDQEKAARTQKHVEEKAQRKAQTQAQAERVGKPAKSEPKPRTTDAPKERKQKTQAEPGNKGHGGGKDKGKGKKP